MISPKTGENVFHCVFVEDIECHHAICSPKIHAPCFLPSFMEILPLWGLHDIWGKTVELIVIVYGKNMNKKT